MGKNLRGGYKLIPLMIDLYALAQSQQSATIDGIEDKIKSTKKHIVLTGLLINGELQNDICKEYIEDDNGLNFVDVYGYNILIDGSDITISEHTSLSVVANPTLAGTEADLTGLEVNGTKYKVPAKVSANPSPAGSTELTGLQIGSDKYKISGGTKLYKHTISFSGGNTMLCIASTNSTVFQNIIDNLIKIIRVSGSTLGDIIDIYGYNSFPSSSKATEKYYDSEAQKTFVVFNSNVNFTDLTISDDTVEAL